MASIQATQSGFIASGDQSIPALQAPRLMVMH